MEKSSFFDAQIVDSNPNIYDREYSAENFAEYFSSFIGNGVFPEPSSNLQIIANEARNIIVKPGTAWINGYFYQNTGDLILTHDVADGVLNRIDRIVVRLDFINREIKTHIKKGTPASIPVAPILQRDTDMHELGLADVSINAGLTSISQANITDLRFNKNICGVVKGTVDQINTTDLFAQYDDSFRTWFENIQGVLDGDTAGQLLNLINANTTAIEDKADQGDLDNLSGQVTSLNSSLALHLADYVKQAIYIDPTGGTSTAYTGNANPPLDAYVDGIWVTIVPHVANGANPTLNIQGKGAVDLCNSKGVKLTAGKLLAGIPYTFRKKGTSFILQGEGGEYGTATASEVLSGYTFGTETGIVNGALALSGDATVANVLSGKTFYNTNPKSKVTGTMPNNGLQSGTITEQGGTKVIPAGYTSGGTVTANILAQPGEYPVVQAPTAKDAPLSLTKVKEIKVLSSGTVRVKFFAIQNVSGYTTNAQIYKNGTPVGISRSVPKGVGTTFSEDFVVIENDLIQLYANRGGTSGQGQIKDFQICSSIQVVSGQTTLD